MYKKVLVSHGYDLGSIGLGLLQCAVHPCNCLLPYSSTATIIAVQGKEIEAVRYFCKVRRGVWILHYGVSISIFQPMLFPSHGCHSWRFNHPIFIESVGSSSCIMVSHDDEDFYSIVFQGFQLCPKALMAFYLPVVGKIS